MSDPRRNVCWYDGHCRRLNCRFLHPSGDVGRWRNPNVGFDLPKRASVVDPVKDTISRLQNFAEAKRVEADVARTHAENMQAQHAQMRADIERADAEDKKRQERLQERRASNAVERIWSEEIESLFDDEGVDSADLCNHAVRCATKWMIMLRVTAVRTAHYPHYADMSGNEDESDDDESSATIHPFSFGYNEDDEKKAGSVATADSCTQRLYIETILRDHYTGLDWSEKFERYYHKSRATNVKMRLVSVSTKVVPAGSKLFFIMTNRKTMKPSEILEAINKM